MNCFTHILFVCGSPTASGSFTWNANAQAMLTDMVPAMKANNIKSIFQICCAGWDWEVSARPENLGGHRTTFITNLLNVISAYNVDGIDLDWEPIQETHHATFRTFVPALRDSMNSRWGSGANRKLIVCYASPGSYRAFASPVHEAIDQINIQGYDLVSPSWSVCSGNGNDYYVSWHQGPCYAGEALCPVGNRMINLNDIAQEFVQHGIPKSKIGISARWNGSVWRGGSGTTTGGVTRPLQTWLTAPTMWNDVPYYYWWADVGRDPLGDARIHDVATGASYISYDAAGSTNDYFISYDDGWACARKVQLVQDSLYGGVYVWTIDGGEQVSGRYPQADSLRASSRRSG